jgi:hypothetical protein
VKADRIRARDERPQCSRRRAFEVATHEAGHIVIALAVGGTATGARIFRDGSGFAFADARRGDRAGALRVFLAGRGAAELLRCGELRGGTRPPGAPRFAPLPPKGQRPGDGANDYDNAELIEEVETGQGRAIDLEGEKVEIVRTLRARWPVVLALAALLYVRGTLTESDILNIANAGA